jgi:amino acid adenylation domain-containing protein/non-ribosomal peptide synthase protein (TIGR01720 family)
MASRPTVPRSALFKRIASELSDASRVTDLLEESRRQRPAPAVEATPPRDPVEELIAEVWAGVLGVERVGREDNFFSLGGQSLIATRMLSRLSQVFGVEIPLDQLFAAPTLAGLAERVQALAGGPQRRLPPPLRRVPQSGDLPLSYAQQRYWLLAQLDPEDSSYNVPLLLELGGTLDVPALAAALDFVVARHEALRTTFASRAGTPVQVAGASLPRPLPLVDLGALPAARRRAEASALAEREVHRPFDLAAGPLIRHLLVRLSGGEHLLLVTTHHIAFDGSAELYLRQLLQSYAALRERRRPALPPLPVQYADYAQWQRETLTGERLAELLAYWQGTLAGELPAVELPYDRPRPAEPTFRGGRRRLRLSRGHAEGLRGLARRQGATPFMTALAIFKALLCRYSGNPDVVVGTPSADRPFPELDGVIGCFVDSLVLRTSLAGALAMSEILRRVRETVLGASAHRQIPFTMLVDALQPERSRNRSPLFQVMFTYQGRTVAGGASPDLAGLTVTYPEIERRTARLDLLVTLWDAGDEIAGAFEYSADLFDPATLDRMIGHFQALLAAAAGVPGGLGGPAAELPLLSGAERHQLLHEWNDTERPFDGDVCLHELFERQAARTPEAVALVWRGGEVGYAELDRRADALARRLAGLGVAPGATVAVYCDRTPAAIVALLAVLKAGGTYVPLEDRFPAARIAWILSALGVRHLLSQPGKLARLRAEGALDGVAHALCLEDQGREAGGALRPSAAAGRLPRALPEAPAYVIFTSGSTGTPKGVVVQHRAVANLIAWVNRTFAVGPGDRGLFVTSFCFDLSVYDVFGLLAAGASLRIASEAELEDPEQLTRVLCREPVTFWNSAPAALRQLAPLFPAAAGSDSLLRLVFLSGDWIPLPLPDQVRRAFPRAEVVSLGGATEAAVWSNVHRIGGIAPHWTSIPYGRPIDNVRYLILSRELEPCPAGVAGDLYIGGACLAAGYAGDPALTARKLVPDPFAVERGGRLYATGDRARCWADGTIEFLGRLDQQVKVRGFRIELGEIEAALLQHPAVREAAVLATGQPREDRKLAACYIPREGAAASPGELHAFLQQRLPEYMVPSAFVPVASWPVTANGKLDRAALAARVARAAVPDSSYAAPGTPAEELLCRIWGQVLGRERVGVHDNFFELGGDSILSIQIVAKAREAGLPISPRQLFQHQTVALLAAAAGAGQEGAGRAEQAAVEAGPVPLTPVQRWFFAQELRDPHHFNQAVLLTVPPGPLPGEAAVAALAAHHAVFRLRFTRGDEGWRQVYDPQAGGPGWARLDLSALPAERRGPALEEAAALIQASLDLERGPLARFLHLDFGAREPGRLLAVVHHLIIDGVSWRILLQDLETVCGDLQAGLPAGTTPFPVWARSLARLAQTETLAAEAGVWLSDRFRQAGRLPVDAAEAAGEGNTVASAATATAELTAEETDRLLRWERGRNTPRIQEALLAALGEAVGAWSGLPAVLVDVEGHGREEIDPEIDLTRSLGWFTQITPVVLSCSGGAAEPQLHAMPAAELIFNYLGQLDGVLGPGRLFAPAPESPGPLRSPRQVRSHLLEVHAAVAGGRLRLGLTYSRNRHRPATAERLMQGVAAALRARLAQRLAAADLRLAGLDPESLGRLLARFPAAEDVYPLTSVQQGILFHTLYQSTAGVYMGQLLIDLPGALDPARLAGAFRRLLARHTALRTGFAVDDLPEPRQVVWSTAELPFEVLDWRQIPAGERQERLDQLLAADRRRGFDLARPPLLRLTLLRMADDLWQLVWTYHHLILDGWSLPLLWREIREGYLPAAADLPPAAPYRDYIEWLRGTSLASAEAFWRRALAGVAAPTPLPASLGTGLAAEPADSAPEIGERRLTLSVEATDRLRAFCRHHHLTLNTVVQGAWSLLLAAHGGQRDVVYGAVSAGRPTELPGVARMVGLFVNTLPVRVELPPPSPVLAWLRELQAGQAELRLWEHTPLPAIQGWSEVPRGVPLFESLFDFENYPLTEAAETAESADGGLAVSRIVNLEQTNYPLALLVAAPRRMALRLVYDRRRFDAAGLARVAGHLDNLLAGLLEHAEGRLEDLSLLSAGERHQLLCEWNDSAVELPAAATFPGLFERQAGRTPEAVAARSANEEITYGELAARVRSLAGWLARQAPAGSVAALYGERGLDYLVGMLAVLRAGFTYLPLSPLQPPQRLAQLLEISRASLLIADERLAPRLTPFLAGLPQPGPAVLPLVSPAVEGRTGALPPPPAPEQLSYLIFTSGSTGVPKGAAVTHLGLLNHLLYKTRFFPLGPGDTVAQTAHQSFDISMWQSLAVLLAGGRIHIYPDEVVRDPGQLLDQLDRDGATVVQMVPSLLRFLLAEAEERGAARPAFSALRWMVPTGETLPVDLCRRFKALYGRVAMCNMFGPTECADNISTFPIREVPGEQELTVSIGRPIANLRFWILGPDDQPVPIGVAGELCVSGPGVGAGYLGEGARTALAFRPHPFARLTAAPGDRLYRSGDLALYRADGTIEFRGRLDHQVKVRGHRIELGEIEAHLARHPEVREAAVVAAEEEGGGTQLIAYVVPRHAEPPRPADLRAALLQALPEAMVPAAFAVLDALPLNPHGKIDRRRLPRPTAAAVPAAVRRRAPSTPVQEILAAIWSALLGVPEIGLDDDFFALGGHSLLATLLVGRVRQRLGVELALASLFECPTLGGLAERLDRQRAGEAGAAAPSIVPVPRSNATPLPLSFAQQRLWFHDQMQPDSPLYNVPLAVQLTGRLDVGALAASLSEVVRRHEVLRTAFPTVDGRASQRIAPPEGSRIPLPVIDLSGLPAEPRAAEVERWSRAELGRPFNLGAGPLLRVGLLRCAAEEHRLLTAMHHIVADGWSMGLLLRETAELYRARLCGVPAALPELPCQYADFAHWQRELLRDERLAAELAYWRRRLAGAPPVLVLPPDRPRPAVPSHRGARRARLLPETLRQELQAIARREGVTLFMVLLAAFQVVVRHQTGCEDVVLGTDVANRNRAETEGLIGFFVNQVVLRTDLSGDPSFAQLLARVRTVCLEAYAHEDVPFDRVVEAVQPERTLSYSPLFQTKINYHQMPVAALELPELTLRPVDAADVPAQLDLILNLIPGSEGLTASIEHGVDLYDAASIDRVFDQYEAVLRRVAGEDARLGALTDMLAEMDRRERDLTRERRRQQQQQKLRAMTRRISES